MLFVYHLIKMSLTRSYVEKLIAVRDAYEREKGPDDGMDKLVRDKLFELLMSTNGNVETVNWCHEQLANERRRNALNPESLIPSGMVEPRRSHNLQEHLQYLQDLRDENRFYDSFRPSRGRHHRYNAEYESEMMPMPMLNPFNSRPSLQREFVPPPAMAAAAAAAASNPNANRRCNNCDQLGHLRRNCPNPPVRGRRGGKTRRHHHNKKGKKSIRRMR